MKDPTSKLIVGFDVSKGYADVHAIDHAGNVILKGRFDDNAYGHDRVCAMLRDWHAKYPKDTTIAAFEATGGLERNWAHTLYELKLPIIVGTLNALVVKRHLEKHLHRSVTDAHSAAGITAYVADGGRLHQTEYDPELDGARDLYHCIDASIKRMTQIKNQLRNLLQRVHPDLVQFMRNDIPEWVLLLLKRYPTAPKLARAKASTLAKIPYVTEERAAALIAAAGKSVAAQTDPFTAISVSHFVRELIDQKKKIEALKAPLFELTSKDTGVRLIESIPGIGKWSALILRLEIGPIERFPTVEKLTAYGGVDPRYHESGDKRRRKHISKHGRKNIRAVLFPCAMAAIRSNPPIAAFYKRLIKDGKPTMVALTAVMRKLLHQIYACWTSNRPFDADYERKRRNQQVKKDDIKKSDLDSAGIAVPANGSLRITAPVSRREAQRRKAAAMPQTRIVRNIRGPGATSRH
jgi:transposase